MMRGARNLRQAAGNVRRPNHKTVSSLIWRWAYATIWPHREARFE